MSGIVLSASVRQNLLSLQSTASLLATTQNDLATGNKVNSALDNPTNYFTAQSLNNRASDINNLLDGIGNGVQVLQAANTGITSLQSLVASAQSIANQALQTTVGYSTKSSVSHHHHRRDRPNLLGTTTYNSTSANSNILYSGAAGGAAAAASTSTLGGTSGVSTGTAVNDDFGNLVAITTSTLLYGASAGADHRGNDEIRRRRYLQHQRQDRHDQGELTLVAASLTNGSRVSGNIVDRRQRQLNGLPQFQHHGRRLLVRPSISPAACRRRRSPAVRRTVTHRIRPDRFFDHGRCDLAAELRRGQDLTVTGKADDLAAARPDHRPPALAMPRCRRSAPPPAAASAH